MSIEAGPDLHDAVNTAPVVRARGLPALDVRERPAICKGKVWPVFKLPCVCNREVNQHGPAFRETREAFGSHR
jgi:hypothetical protein